MPYFKFLLVFLELLCVSHLPLSHASLQKVTAGVQSSCFCPSKWLQSRLCSNFKIQRLLPTLQLEATEDRSQGCGDPTLTPPWTNTLAE